MAADSEAQRAWVMKVLQIDTTRGADAAPAVDDAQMAARLKAVVAQIDALKAEGDPGLPPLMTALSATVAALKARSTEAGGLLDSLEGETAHAMSMARGRAAAREVAGAVDYGKLMLRWHSAQRRVEENLVTLGKALLADPEIIADPDFDDIQEAVGELPDLVPELGGQLDDLLDEARSAGDRRPELHRQALKLLGQYRKQLGGISALRELEGFSAETSAGSLRLFSEFADAFNDLEAELSKSV